MLKVLVTGDRYWGDRERIKQELEKFGQQAWIIEGGAPGADYAAGMAAEKLGQRHIVVPAPWGFYGKPAGPIRNGWMLDLHPDVVLAFHPDLSRSKGTLDCVTQAKKRCLEVKIIQG